MTDTITIPPEAVEAGARVLHANLELFEDLPWEDLSDADQDEYREQIRAAIHAALKAWPGAEWLYVSEPVLALPMPK